jgi:hypothetical protein
MSRRLVTLDPFALQFKQLLKQCADGAQFLVESVEHLLDVAGFRQSYHDNLLRIPCPQCPGRQGRATSVGGYFIFALRVPALHSRDEGYDPDDPKVIEALDRGRAERGDWSYMAVMLRSGVGRCRRSPGVP